MKRVLVTGVGGFIGRHVIEPLAARGYEVHGVVSAPRELPGPMTAHVADLLAPGCAERLVREIAPTHLLHLAWVSNPGRAMMSLDNVRWIATSLDLYRSFVEAGGRRAVLIGSCAEYDWSHTELREDDTPLRPRSIYGVAKNAVREVVEALARQTNVSTAWARLFFLFGPHEPPGRLVSEVAAGLVAGRATTTTEGRQERDFLHVVDAAEALARLLDGPVTGAVNVASGQCVPVRQLIDALGTLSGRPDLLAIGGRPTSPEEPSRLAADIGRLRDEVGFVPRYPLDEGLADTLQWWRGQASGGSS
jgi:nucleoside-diphosphate-sugar epimerase